MYMYLQHALKAINEAPVFFKEKTQSAFFLLIK